VKVAMGVHNFIVQHCDDDDARTLSSDIGERTHQHLRVHDDIIDLTNERDSLLVNRQRTEIADAMWQQYQEALLDSDSLLSDTSDEDEDDDDVENG
ncbi:MAG: hypothetical protein ACRDL7_16220, partial [Gaiellaceae bacterium]